jgi:uncharacterized protein YbjT (DUF2867 family)
MKAVIIGATGLVGNLILKEVLNDSHFTEVRIFVRKPTGITDPKLKEVVSPMKDIQALGPEVVGDVLFNAMGTTIKQAGSQAEQQRIDRDIPVQFAKVASENGVRLMLNVSSVGASMKGNFYLRTKAEMEQGTENYFPGMIFHFRPSFLAGNRKEYRLAEKILLPVMKIFDLVLAGSTKKYRTMPVDKLAKAIINVSKHPEGKLNILHYSEIMECVKG